MAEELEEYKQKLAKVRTHTTLAAAVHSGGCAALPVAS